MLLPPACVTMALVVTRGALFAAPATAKQLIDSNYLSLPRDSRWMTASDVYAGLLWATDPLNPRTAGAGLGLLLIAVLLIPWQGSPWRSVRRWRGWPSVLLVTTAAALLVFSWSIHPRESLSIVAAPHPTAVAVRQLLDGRRTSEGPARVLGNPVLNQIVSDRLAPLGLQDAGGYSSLEPSRYRAYMRRVRQVDDDLLDLWNVRYVPRPGAARELPAYRGVQYLSENPLLRTTDGGEDAFRIPAGIQTTEVRLISALADATSVPQGQAVGSVSLHSETGRVVAQGQVRAGVESMDWAWDAVAPWDGVRHARVEAAADVQVTLGSGATAKRVLSFARLVFEQPVGARTLQLRNLLPRGELMVYGAAVVDGDGQLRQLFGRTEKTKYREVFRADGIVVLENTGALPRAFMVQHWRQATVGTSLDVMQRRTFAPRDEVVLASDTPPTERGLAVAATPGRAAPLPPEHATIEAYTPQEVHVHVDTPLGGFLVLTDAYYPGWRAYIDGVERPMLCGDMVFRVVQVSEGSHEVVISLSADELARWSGRQSRGCRDCAWRARAVRTS